MTLATDGYQRFDAKNASGVPAELRALRRWVCWKLVPRRADKPAKVPVSAHGGEASVTDPKTWATFDEAVARYLKEIKKLHGIGFVFADGDEYTGVDIDDCRDATTGAVGAWATEIVKQLDSYTELSPSETGFKIIIKATVPGAASRRNKIEMYSRARYFTITGKHVMDTPLTIEQRQGPLTDLYREVFGAAAESAEPVKPAAQANDPRLIRVQSIPDDELLNRAARAANGVKFGELWSGSVAGHGGDQSRADAALCAILAYWTRGDIERIDRLFRRSKLFRAKWDERRGNQTYGQRTVANAVAVAAAFYDPDQDRAAEQHNDLANATLFEQLSTGRFRHCGALKAWLAWNEVHWDRDSDVLLRVALEAVPVELSRRAAALENEKDRQRAIKWAVSCGEAWRLASLEKVLTWRLEVPLGLLDQRPLLFACANGVLDLQAGVLREGVPMDWLTRASTVRFDPKAKCPRWDKFLNEIMEGRRDMVEYLWRVIGYCLTGDTSERAFFILCGNGRNGKSTFIETLHALLSPGGRGYAQKARFTTFLQKGQVNQGANDDVAHLAGARLVVAAESSGRAPLDVPLVKELTGSDTIRARHLYGREFEFRPSFKLFLVTNHVPPIHESTYALWDRLHYVPFDFRVPDDRVDARLPLELLGELEGVLARAAVACREWLTEGLQPPPEVLRARGKLQESNDLVGEFIRECLEESPGHQQPHPELYGVFNAWVRRSGLRTPPTSRHLADALETRGWASARTGGNIRTWTGWRIKAGVPGQGYGPEGLEL